MVGSEQGPRNNNLVVDYLELKSQELLILARRVNQPQEHSIRQELQVRLVPQVAVYLGPIRKNPVVYLELPAQEAHLAQQDLLLHLEVHLALRQADLEILLRHLERGLRHLILD